MKLEYCEYTNNMFLSKRSKIWSYFNNMRLDKTDIFIKKYNEGGSILEVGTYDGYYISSLFKKGLLKKNNYIVLSDIYDTSKEGIYYFIENNVNYFKEKYPRIKFDIISSCIEVLDKKVDFKVDNFFIFETLEHVNDEKLAIKNISKILNDDGRLFVSLPVEFGFLFFIKDLGRRFILKKDYHNLKELFWGLIGRTDKIKRVPRGHKGYDYRYSIDLLAKKGFKVVKKSFYPININFLSYGVVMVLEKK